MTQTSSGKTQGSLNIINVKNTLKACSIRVKQGALLTAFIPRALPWAKSFCPFRAFQPYRSINLKFVFVYLFAEIETNADAIIVFGDFADSTESGVAAQGSQRLDDGKQFLRLEENADAR